MILDPTTSMTRLKQFFSDTLPNNTLEIPDLIHPEVLLSNSNESALVINNDNIKTILLSNSVQSPYIITGKNLHTVDLSSLTQTEFNNQNLTASAADYLLFNFLQETKLESLELPNFIGTRNEIPASGVAITNELAKRASFRNNYWLKIVSMGNSLMSASNNNSAKFNGFWFQNNYSLVALKLNYPYVIPIDRNEGLYTTPIDSGSGYIYVPADLVNSYKSTAIWSRFGDVGKIKSLNEYETDIQRYNDTITDDWSTIISNCNSGGYGKYPIGGTKTLYLDGVPIQMVIVDKDADTKTDGNKAPLTWLTNTISLFTRYNLATTFSDAAINFNNATENYRAIFTNTIWNGLDPIIQAGIKSVRKYSKGYEGTSTSVFNNSLQSVETIWPPSASELNLASYTSPYAYFSTASGAANRPNYFLGLTNLTADENNITVTVGTRDYTNTTGYPDVLRSTGINSRMEVVYGSTTNSYIIFGFCT